MITNEITKTNLNRIYNLPRYAIDREILNLLITNPYNTIRKLSRLYNQNLPSKDPETIRRHLRKLYDQNVVKMFTITYIDDSGLTNADQDGTELTEEEKTILKRALQLNDFRSGGFKDKPGMMLDIYWITNPIKKIIEEKKTK